MTFSIPALRHAALAVSLAAATLVAACGGGDQVTTFEPKRIIALGDESSVLLDPGATANGRKYSINALATDKVTLDCKTKPIWIQVLATAYGLVFPECNPAPNAVASPASRIHAVPGATVAGLAAQVAAAGALTSSDLVTVYIGSNDILAQYASYNGSNADALVAAVKSAGVTVGKQVNALTESGARVLLVLAPDLSLTPYALAEEAAHAGENRRKLILKLVDEFNASARVTIQNDGRKIALLKTNELIQNLVRNVGVNSLNNVVDVACDIAKAPLLQNCSTETLVAAATATGVDVATWLWADATHLSAGGQVLLGSSAVNQVSNNPF